MATAQLGQARGFSIETDNARVDAARPLPGRQLIQPVLRNLKSRRTSRRTVVILLGPPGSGKGTQCKRVSNALAVPTISSGDILRANIRACTDLGLKAKEAMDRGALVSDQLICEMLLSRISQADCKAGFVLDGIPRTVRQAEFIDLQLLRSAGGDFDPPRIVSLEVEESTILRRLSGRRVCPDCGATYNIETNPPQLTGRCDSDGTMLETREDDREEVCKFRLEAHRKVSSAIKGYYSSKYGVVEINGDRDAEVICKELLEIVSINV